MASGYRLHALLTALFCAVIPMAAQEPVLELEPAVLVVTQDPVKTVGDTVIFNPAAFSLEDDAMLEDFLKKIPGLEYDGKSVTLYGRKITSLLVNGRLYFGGDLITGLKNISAESIENIRTYERQSDFARISGIDDGEGQPVLDVRIKRRFMDSWRGNTRAAGGVPSRYLGSFNLNRLTDTSRITIVGNAGNVPAAATIARTGLDNRGSGARGENNTRSAGVDYSIRKKNLELESHLNWNGNNASVEAESESRTVQAKSISFYRGSNESMSRGDKLTSDTSLEWRPNRFATILLKPSLSYNDNGSWSNPVSATYNALPESGLSPVNTTERSTGQFRRQGSARLVAQFTRRFAKKGRSATVRFSGQYSGGDSWSFEDYSAFYSKKTTVRKQVVGAPSSNSETSLQLSFNEPVGRSLNAQFVVSARYLSTSLWRDFYSLESFDPAWEMPRSLSRGEVFASLPSGYKSALDPQLTSDGSYNGFFLAGTLGIKYVRKKLNLSAGVSLRPVWSEVLYNTAEQAGGRASSYICYAAPNVTLRYNRSKREFLSLKYNSHVATPSPGNLIPLRNGSNPLAVRVGNPDQKPSFVQNISFTYNYSNPGKGRSLVCEFSGRYIDNAFTTSTEYFPETGARVTRSCNISGNHSLNGSIAFNRSFKGTPVSIGNTLSGAYSRGNTYLYNPSIKADELNTMQRITGKELMVVTAKWHNFDVSGRFGAEYSSAMSLLRTEFAEEPVSLRAGVEANMRFPGRWRVSSEAGYVVNRGFAYANLNSDYFIWNASVSKTVFSGRGTLRLEASDIPGTQKNMTHRFSGMTIGSTTFNGSLRYVILNFIWRFKSR